MKLQVTREEWLFSNILRKDKNLTHPLVFSSNLNPKGPPCPVIALASGCSRYGMFLCKSSQSDRSKQVCFTLWVPTCKIWGNASGSAEFSQSSWYTFLSRPKAWALRCVFCVSLVAAEGNAEQVCIVLPAQTALTLHWAELNLTWAVKSQQPLEGARGGGKQLC